MLLHRMVPALPVCVLQCWTPLRNPRLACPGSRACRLPARTWLCCIPVSCAAVRFYMSAPSRGNVCNAGRGSRINRAQVPSTPFCCGLLQWWLSWLVSTAERCLCTGGPSGYRCWCEGISRAGLSRVWYDAAGWQSGLGHTTSCCAMALLGKAQEMCPWLCPKGG